MTVNGCRVREWLGSASARGLLLMAVLGALILVLPAVAAASSRCTRGTRDCLRGVVRNQTGASLRLQSTGTFVAGSTHTRLPRRVVRRDTTSAWAVQAHASSRPVGMVVRYRAGSLTYSMAAVRIANGHQGEFVACWEPKAQGGGAARSCAALWGGAGPRGNAFDIGGQPSIPAVGERCRIAAAARQQFDCTAGGQISEPESRHARRVHAGRIALEFKNLGLAPVRISVGHGRPCTIRSHNGRCGVTDRAAGAHITVRNLRSRRAKIDVEIVAEANGPHPPADLAQYQAPSPGAPKSSSDCTGNYDNQGGAYWDGNGPGWPNDGYFNGSKNANPWPVSCSLPGDWMSSLSGATYLDQLTLPGTHDTGTWTFTSSSPEYWTQSLSLPDQLAVGIRAIDIRLQNAGCPSSGCGSANPLGIYHNSGGDSHGASSSGFTGGYLNAEGSTTGPNGGSSPDNALYSVMPELQAFLSANPTETIVMNIQDEATSSSDPGTPGFSSQVNDVLGSYEGDNIPDANGDGGSHPMVYEGSQGPNPPLSAIRGEVVVIANGGEPGSTRDYPDPPSGLLWQQTTSPNPGPPFVQDNYKSPWDKWNDIQDELNWAANLDSYGSIAGGGERSGFHQDTNINFISASSAAEPRTYAGNWGERLLDECTGDISGQDEGCNVLTLKYIAQYGDTCKGASYLGGNGSLCRYGIVYTDFPGPTLINALIGQNP